MFIAFLSLLGICLYHMSGQEGKLVIDGGGGCDQTIFLRCVIFLPVLLLFLQKVTWNLLPCKIPALNSATL